MPATNKLEQNSNASPNFAQPAPERIFYDGHCGLCHRWVRFVVNRDRHGNLFRFAPLQGPTFERLIPPARRAALPDSVVLLTADGALLTRSDAAIHILRRLGGFWRASAALISIFPRFLRDAVYNFIARIRYRIFGRRPEVCPVTPANLRARFDD